MNKGSAPDQVGREFTTLGSQAALNQVKALLRAANLPTQDLDEAKDISFVVCGPVDKPIAVVGLELHRPYGLLRSLAVSRSARTQGLGTQLVAEIERVASERELRAVYLLTNTAAAFFRRLGYAVQARGLVPTEIKRTSEFANICPDDATVMWKALQRD